MVKYILENKEKEEESILRVGLERRLSGVIYLTVTSHNKGKFFVAGLTPEGTLALSMGLPNDIGLQLQKNNSENSKIKVV